MRRIENTPQTWGLTTKEYNDGGWGKTTGNFGDRLSAVLQVNNGLLDPSTQQIDPIKLEQLFIEISAMVIPIIVERFPILTKVELKALDQVTFTNVRKEVYKALKHLMNNTVDLLDNSGSVSVPAFSKSVESNLTILSQGRLGNDVTTGLSNSGLNSYSSKLNGETGTYDIYYEDTVLHVKFGMVDTDGNFQPGEGPELRNVLYHSESEIKTWVSQIIAPGLQVEYGFVEYDRLPSITEVNQDFNNGGLQILSGLLLTPANIIPGAVVYIKNTNSLPTDQVDEYAAWWDDNTKSWYMQDEKFKQWAILAVENLKQEVNKLQSDKANKTDVDVEVTNATTSADGIKYSTLNIKDLIANLNPTDEYFKTKWQLKDATIVPNDPSILPTANTAVFDIPTKDDSQKEIIRTKSDVATFTISTKIKGIATRIGLTGPIVYGYQNPQNLKAVRTSAAIETLNATFDNNQLTITRNAGTDVDFSSLQVNMVIEEIFTPKGQVASVQEVDQLKQSVDNNTNRLNNISAPVKINTIIQKDIFAAAPSVGDTVVSTVDDPSGDGTKDVYKFTNVEEQGSQNIYMVEKQHFTNNKSDDEKFTVECVETSTDEAKPISYEILDDNSSADAVTLWGSVKNRLFGFVRKTATRISAGFDSINGKTALSFEVDNDGTNGVTGEDTVNDKQWGLGHFTGDYKIFYKDDQGAIQNILLSELKSYGDKIDANAQEIDGFKDDIEGWRKALLVSQAIVNGKPAKVEIRGDKISFANSQLESVAAGTKDTDAVNVAQLHSTINPGGDTKSVNDKILYEKVFNTPIPTEQYNGRDVPKDFDLTIDQSVDKTKTLFIEAAVKINWDPNNPRGMSDVFVYWTFEKNVENNNDFEIVGSTIRQIPVYDKELKLSPSIAWAGAQGNVSFSFSKQDSDTPTTIDGDAVTMELVYLKFIERTTTGGGPSGGTEINNGTLVAKTGASVVDFNTPNVQQVLTKNTTPASDPNATINNKRVKDIQIGGCELITSIVSNDRITIPDFNTKSKIFIVCSRSGSLKTSTVIRGGISSENKIQHDKMILTFIGDKIEVSNYIPSLLYRKEIK